MTRARLLGGAVAIAACVISGAATAQISPCNVLGSPLPPPCLVLDASKIATQVEEIQQKVGEVEELVAQAKEMTDIQGALGAITKLAKGPLGAVVPIAPHAPVTAEAASEEFLRSLPDPGSTSASRAVFQTALQRANRASAGDGWSVAQASKARMAEMAEKASSIQRDLESSQDLRGDWQVNNNAKALLMQAMAFLKELRAARIQATATRTYGSTGGRSGIMKRASSAQLPPAVTSEWAPKLAKIANLSNKLSALMAAKSIYASYQESIAGHRDTQNEYAAVLRVAQQAQAAVQNLANSDGARRGIDPSYQMSIVDRYMGQDQTAWDDSSKTDVAGNLASAARNELNRAGRKSASGSWDDVLKDRAEAYKQEAYFRPIAEEARQLEQADIASLQEYQSSIGVDLSDPAAIDAEIARTREELGVVGNEISTAPAEIVAQRDAIYQSNVDPAAKSQQEMAAVDAAAGERTPSDPNAFITSSAGNANMYQNVDDPAPSEPVDVRQDGRDQNPR